MKPDANPANDRNGLWAQRIASFHYAFQPIVNIHTGVVFGYEALLRGHEPAGFDSIPAVFDAAYDDGVLPHLSHSLLSIARRSLDARLPQGCEARLFYNVDNRAIATIDTRRTPWASADPTTPGRNRLCIEVSERYPIPPIGDSRSPLARMRPYGVLIALDDFGTGYSGLQELYRSAADIIKIDRFFVCDIDTDATKHLFVANLVGLAHSMGLRVIAEGVETAAEFSVCRDVGCDYVQGFLVARPEDGTDPLPPRYERVTDLVRSDRRRNSSPEEIIAAKLIRTAAIRVDAPLLAVLRRFRSEPDTTVIPVVDEHDEPLGVLRERDMKEYVYNPYGISLLMNRRSREQMFGFVRKVPIVSSKTRLKQLLEVYTKQVHSEALLVVDEGKYVGYLDSRAVLGIIHDSEIALARDQNPLSNLPGNNVIGEVLAEVFSPTHLDNIITYFDLNDFKPYNDTYGFRNGDRVIQLFADLLKAFGIETGAFVGHVGGDDFFASLPLDGVGADQAVGKIEQLLSRFSLDVRGFYDPVDGKRGYIIAEDREGVTRHFELLTVSAAVFEVPAHTDFYSADAFSRQIAEAKKRAKSSPTHIDVSRIPISSGSLDPTPSADATPIGL